MHGDMGDGDDPPPPPPPPAVLLLMMMMMALATAPLFKLSAAAEQQTEQSQRAARNFYCPLLLQPQRSSRAPNTTEYQQNINRTSKDHRQNIDRTSEIQQNINRTSTEHQNNFDRISGFFHSSTTPSPNFGIFQFGCFFLWGTWFFLFPRASNTTEYQQHINSSSHY
jgi:hypothetical protein